MKRCVILISGRGSNMVSLLDVMQPGECAAVISNRPDAGGLAIAAARGVPTCALDHRSFESREAFDAAMSAAIDQFAPDLLLLAGFMRILTEDFVRNYAGRMLNIHPSLLPSFPGVHTHRQALAAGVRIHGASVHFVTPALDGGPIVAQAAVPVFATDDETSLAARVLAEEHTLYPRVARWFLDGQLALHDDKVVLAGERAGGAVARALHAPLAR